MRWTLGSIFVTILLIVPLFQLQAASNEDCAMCHSDPEMTTERQGRIISLYIDFDRFSHSVHKDLECVDCHSDADVEEFPHPEHLEKVDCGNCHSDESDQFYQGVHGLALKRGAPYAPNCQDCHGVHYILPPSNPKSKTYKMNIPYLCGKCHREGAPVAEVYNIPEKDILNNYSQSIHGEGLLKRGLIVSATCNDCHGNHLILPHTNPKSTISVNNVAKTCTKCHVNIEKVHVKVIRGELWEKAPGAIPACTDCHQPHKVKKANLVARSSDRECLSCHAKEDVHKTVDGKVISLTVHREDIQSSVHKNIPCVKCHSDVDPARHRPCETAGRVDCSKCHAEIAEQYFESDHGQAYFEKNPDAPYCTDCHGDHKTLSHRDERDKTYRANIPQLCGDCHSKLAQKDTSLAKMGNVLVDYSTSVHGRGLTEKGLLPSAVCTDCHNSHLILNSKDEKSSVYYKNVPATCATCHRGIYKQYITSVHSPMVTKTDKKLPTCEDCHSAHKIKEHTQDKFITEVTEQCGSCHEDLAKTYFETIHGKAYMLGYTDAAKCSDCHGSHDILPVNDPNSRVGIHNVVQTCQQCHEDANMRFTGYLTHATHHDKTKYPVLYYTFWAMTILLISVFSFFGLHTLLWLPRSFRHLRERRKKSKVIENRYCIQRFTPGQRLTHLFVIISFLTLALTGMMLKFSGMPWAHFLANLLGGVRVAGTLHRIAAVITFGYFFTHLYSLIKMKITQKMTWKEVVFGENSMWFNKKDLQDFWGTIKWFLGLGPRPKYGRWTYWEKFDYLAVFWGVAIIGLSGLMLWFPEFFAKFLPGWFINVADIIHSDEALLAVGFIFTIHFFNTHLRPESFPLDPVIFTGQVPLDEYKEDRPEEYERLKKTGLLKKKVVFSKVSPKTMRIIRFFGYTFLATGIILIILIIYSMLFGYK